MAPTGVVRKNWKNNKRPWYLKVMHLQNFCLFPLCFLPFQLQAGFLRLESWSHLQTSRLCSWKPWTNKRVTGRFYKRFSNPNATLVTFKHFFSVLLIFRPTLLIPAEVYKINMLHKLFDLKIKTTICKHWVFYLQCNSMFSDFFYE